MNLIFGLVALSWNLLVFTQLEDRLRENSTTEDNYYWTKFFPLSHQKVFTNNLKSFVFLIFLFKFT